MKKVFIIIVILAQLQSFSQEKSYHNYYWNGQENYQAIIGIKNCYVRTNPDANSVLLDSLQIGNEIKVIKSTDNDYKVKGVNVSWVEIEYINKKGIASKGYLWKGFLALGYFKKADLTYLTTIEKVEINKENGLEDFAITVKILNNKNSILGQKTLIKNLGEASLFENKTIDGFGLSNIIGIYRIGFLGEACGIASTYYYFAWNGKQISILPEKTYDGEASIYYHSEDFIFPKEKGGKPNIITKVIEEGENTDETGEKRHSIYNINVWNEIYKWNGEKVIFIEKTKVKKYKKKY